MAGGRAANLVIKILVDSANAVAGVDQAASSFDRFESRMKGLAVPAGVVAGAIVAVGISAVNSASRTEQAMGALDSVFGANSDVVKGWAADAADSVGLARSEYGELASVLGAQLNNLGVDTQTAMDGTQDLIGLGADLAATFGGSTTDAVNALSSALRGEADPAERYGLALNQTAVNAYLAEQGLDGLTGEAATAARAQAIMAMATEQAGGAVGQFGREADTAAGQQQRANAAWENAKSDLGEGLLPAVTAVTAGLADMAGWVSENTTLVTAIVGVIGGLAVGILAVNAALQVYRAVQTIATAVQWAANAAWLASPITWIIIGIAAITAGIILLWNKNEGFRNFVIGAWTAIQNAAVTAWNGIRSVVSTVVSWIQNAVATVGRFVSTVWNSIRSSATSVWNAILGVVRGTINGITSVVTSVRTTVTNVWNSIRSASTSVWNAVRSAATSALNAILAPVRALKSAFDSVIAAVRSVINWIGRIRMPEISLPFGLSLGDLFSAPAPSIAPAALGAPGAAGARGYPTLFAAAPRAAGGAGNGYGAPVIINVRGTLNDTDSARAVRRVLRNDSRRRGGVVIGAGA